MAGERDGEGAGTDDLAEQGEWVAHLERQARAETDPARRIALTAVAREFAEYHAQDVALAERKATAGDRVAASAARKRGAGPTAVVTLRLEHADIEALHRRAELLQIPPSRLAANLIRSGLSQARSTSGGASSARLASLATDLEATTARLRELAVDTAEGSVSQSGR